MVHQEITQAGEEKSTILGNREINRRHFLKISGALATGLATTGLASTLASCGAPKQGGTAGEITFVNIAGHPTSELFRTRAADFQKKTGIKVSLQQVPYADMRSKEIAEMMSRSGRYDVIDASNAWVGEYAARGWIDALDGYMDSDKDFRKDHFLGAALNIYRYNGKQYSIPFMFGPRAMYYRSDLLSGVPATRDEWLQAAENVTKDGVYGTTLEGKKVGFSAVQFLEFLWQNGGEAADADGIPTFNSDAGVAALQLMYDLLYKHKVVPPDALGLWETDYVNLFQNGKIAMMNIWPWMYAKASDPKNSEVVGKFSVALEPKEVRRTSFIGTTGLCIPSSSRNKDAAWELIKYLTGTEFQTELGKEYGVEMANKAAVQDLIADLGDEGKYLEVHLKAGETGKSFPVYPWWTQGETILTEAVQNVLTRRMGPKESLDAAAKRMTDAAKDWEE